MGISAREIGYVIVNAAAGDILLKAKTGEDPEYKLATGSIESSADGMTNTGELIIKSMLERSYISGVFGFEPKELDKIQATINDARINPNPEIPISAVMTDGAILGNAGGVFVGGLISDGPGTITLRFESATDFVEQ